jgi:hypothetical protein
MCRVGDSVWHKKSRLNNNEAASFVDIGSNMSTFQRFDARLPFELELMPAT